MSRSGYYLYMDLVQSMLQRGVGADTTQTDVERQGDLYRAAHNTAATYVLREKRARQAKRVSVEELDDAKPICLPSCAMSTYRLQLILASNGKRSEMESCTSYNQRRRARWIKTSGS